MNTIANPMITLRAVARGYLPRIFQPRGWTLAALVVLPVAIMLPLSLIARAQGEPLPVTMALTIFHIALVSYVLPIIALMAAPAGVREDLEQRTLPLMLVRPVAVWMLPIGKGILWFGWGSLWIIVVVLGMLGLGTDLALLPAMMVALIAAYWAQLGFMTLLGLLFKRGTLWGIVYLFLQLFLSQILPGNLQRLTINHYVECITGTRATEVRTSDLLAQAPVITPVWVCLLVLFLFGLACWAACGWKLHRTPVGLAGAEAEG